MTGPLVQVCNARASMRAFIPHWRFGRRRLGLFRRKCKMLEKPKKRGRKTTEETIRLVAVALKQFQELERLDATPLGRMSAIQRSAEVQYRDAMFPIATAVRAHLMRSLETLARNIEGVSTYQRELELLYGLFEGESVAEISRRMNLSREHVARTIQPRAIRLLTKVLILNLRDENAPEEQN